MLQSTDARRIIDSLRYGIPPEGHITDFTVGRKEEIDELNHLLINKETTALLLKSNYGSGKTHLLKLIRELALSYGYVVSLVTLDSKSAVRFNRMDQIFGQVCRQIEVPRQNGKSIRYLFDSVSSKCSNSTKIKEEIKDISNLTNETKWSHSRFLASPALYVALRAWFFGTNTNKDFIEDWLFQPWEYKSQRKKIYSSLVGDMRRYFNDPRPDWHFYKDNIFDFNNQGYRQSWDALNDLDKLAKVAGFKGLILLVDEFEDVIHNLKNIKYQQTAFWNLFQFFAGEYQGYSFFAVTPDFAEKCKSVLLNKDIYDYDYSRFDQLKTFQLPPLTDLEMQELSKKITTFHSKAYNWIVSDNINEKLSITCKKGMKIPVEDRVRQTIKEMINLLDSSMEEYCEQ